MRWRGTVISTQSAASSEMYQAAYLYLNDGRSVFPVCNPAWEGHTHRYEDEPGKWTEDTCRNPGKTPLVPWRRFITQRATEEQIAIWWKRWPDANIGMATGTVSGVVVLDCDGADARKDALRLGGVDQTPTIFTGKPGSAHFWLQAPDEHVKNFARKMGAIDFRGDGGYAVLPPSMHVSGAQYRWAPNTSQLNLAPIPTWLWDLIRKSERGDDNGITTFDTELVLDGIPQGQRDQDLWSFAGKLRADNVPLQYAELMVRQAARACVPPFDENTALEKVRRAYREYDPTPVLVPSRRVTQEPEPEELVQTLGDLMDMPIPSDVQLVDGIIWGHRVTWAFAAPGVGKTLFLLAAGLHVAAGRPFCGHAVQQGPVLLIEEDSPFYSLRDYVETLADIYDIDPRAIPFYLNKRQGLRVTDAAGVAKAKAIVAACPLSPSWVIIDACERVAPSDKYTSKEMDPLATFLQWLMGELITPTVIDHTKLVNVKDAKSINPIDRLFGGLTKKAISDVMLYFSGGLRSGQINIEFAKFRGDPPGSLVVNWANDEGFTIKHKTTKIGLTPTEQKITRWFQNTTVGWYGRQAIEDGAAVNGRSSERALAELVRKGWLRREGDDGVPAVWSLNTQTQEATFGTP